MAAIRCGFADRAGFDVKLHRAGLRLRGNLHPRQRLEPFFGDGWGDEGLFGRQQWALGVDPQIFMASLNAVPCLFQGIVDASGTDDRGLGRQVIDDVPGLFKEQRHVGLNACGHLPFRHALIDAVTGEITGECIAVLASKSLDAGIIGWKRRRRQWLDLCHHILRALRLRVEQSNRIDLVVEPVDAVGRRAAHRKQVHQGTAQGILAVALDLSHGLVARRLKGLA